MVTNELSMMASGMKNGNGGHDVALWQRRVLKKDVNEIMSLIKLKCRSWKRKF